MKRRFLILSVIVLALILLRGSCPKPDLVITSFGSTGESTILLASDDSDSLWVVPLRMIVENAGTNKAGEFKVGVQVQYEGESGWYVVSFTVPGETSIWYPYCEAGLNPSDEETFEGNVYVSPKGTRPTTIKLKGMADCGYGDEFMPDYVRVDESDETNNESEATPINIP